MADIPSSVGWMTVKGQIALAVADSLDSGRSPDMAAAKAKVTFSADLPSSDPLVVAATGLMIIPADIVATLDGNGVLRGEDGAADVTMIAPDQIAITPFGWDWVATIEPIEGNSWRPFNRRLRGKPNELVNLGLQIARTPSSGLITGLVFPAEDTEAPYPDDFRIGVDMIITPDGKLWRIDNMGATLLGTLTSSGSGSGNDGIDGREAEFRASSTHFEWRYIGETTWRQIKPWSELRGNDGASIELQATATMIQWRPSGGTWQDLKPIADLKGTKGDAGLNGTLLYVDGEAQTRYDIDTTAVTAAMLNAGVVIVAGTNGNAARIPGALHATWIMAAGVVPVNAADTDEIITRDA